MKILQLGKFYPIRGGVEKVMYDIMSGLSDSGIFCDMLCAVAMDQKSGVILQNKHSRIFCMPTLIKLAATMISPAMIIKMWRIKDDYDVVHIHHPDPMACMALFFSGYKGKVVLHWHSDILKQKFLLKLFAPFQNWLINRADVIVGTTPVYVEQSPFLQDVQHKVMHIPIGIQSLPPCLQSSDTIRKRYPGKKIVFSLGRLVEYKGFSFLIEAASLLGDEYIFLIGGTGPLKESLEKQINELGLTRKVILQGYIPDEDLPAYYQACDLFVLSSVLKTEAFAIVQIEAMSCGKPVVATKIEESGVSWVNKDGVSGLNVDICNPKAMADAISHILSDQSLYQRLSHGALKRYKELFTMEHMTSNCINLYQHLLQIAEGVVMKKEPSPALDFPLRIKDHLILRQVGSRFIVINPGNEMVNLTNVYSLNSTAAWLWKQLKGLDFTVETIVRLLEQKYGIARKEAKEDADALLRVLISNELLQSAECE